MLISTTLFGAPFKQGSKNVGFNIGAGSSFGVNYTILGINASYFVVDNLQAGLEYRGWLGDGPAINEISIPVTYIAPLHEKFRPYVGGFFRKTFLDSSQGNDYSVYGVRAGVSMITSGNSYASFGWVQEYYDNSVGDSSNGYPEVAVGLSF